MWQEFLDKWNRKLKRKADVLASSSCSSSSSPNPKKPHSSDRSVNSSSSAGGAALACGIDASLGESVPYWNTSVDGDFNEKARNVCKQWFVDHIANPYPSDRQKEFLARLCRVSFEQVNSFFIKARGGLWPKMIEGVNKGELKPSGICHPEWIGQTSSAENDEADSSIDDHSSGAEEAAEDEDVLHYAAQLTVEDNLMKDIVSLNLKSEYDQVRAQALDWLRALCAILSDRADASAIVAAHWRNVVHILNITVAARKAVLGVEQSPVPQPAALTPVEACPAPASSPSEDATAAAPRVIFLNQAPASLSPAQQANIPASSGRAALLQRVLPGVPFDVPIVESSAAAAECVKGGGGGDKPLILACFNKVGTEVHASDESFEIL